MNKPFSIAPSPELVEQWLTEFYGATMEPGEATMDLAARAAQWGADQELEACCMWITREKSVLMAEELGVARRPKPPSLKKQALEAQYRLMTGAWRNEDWQLISRALETLPDD